ncbi:MAG: STAS domain-containing protein [Planctomycetaceae bacterium]|nr:STAS domain-containing protein [Planctomycetaceae bacterium]
MPQSARHPSSHLYPYELFGNTLVVRPHGDALGFSVHEMRSEMGQVKELACDPRVRHLLVDLSAEHYYGSMVLGDLIEFGQLVKTRGGRIGLCGVSSDLATVLRMMHLDQQWEIFPDTESGLRAVAVIPATQRLWRYRWVAVWLIAVGAAGVAYAFWPATDRGAVYYAELTGVWRDYDERRGKVGEEEGERLRRRLRVKLEPIFADLSHRGKNQPLTEVEQSLLFATRRWREAMDLTGPVAEMQYDEARLYLELAGEMLSQPPRTVEQLPLAAIPNASDAAADELVPPP